MYIVLGVWRLPANVFVPTGNGVATTAVWGRGWVSGVFRVWLVLHIIHRV